MELACGLAATPLVSSHSPRGTSNASIGSHMTDVIGPCTHPASCRGSPATSTADATTPSHASGTGIFRPLAAGGPAEQHHAGDASSDVGEKRETGNPGVRRASHAGILFGTKPDEGRWAKVSEWHTLRGIGGAGHTGIGFSARYANLDRRFSTDSVWTHRRKRWRP